MSIEWPRAIQILALKEVTSKEPSADFGFRSVARWYSKTFATPLDRVYSLPTLDVLQAYYEDKYEELAGTDTGHMELRQLLEELSKSDEELAAARKEQDKEEVFVFKESQACLEHNGKVNTIDLKAKQKLAKDKLEKIRRQAKEMEAMLEKDSLGTTLDFSKSAEAVPAVEEPQEFNVDFTGLGDIGDMDSLSSFTGLK
jgi:hypothetical protein